MKKLRLLGLVALLALADRARAAESSADIAYAGILLIVNEGKLAHAVRATEINAASYPGDLRFPALRTQLLAALAREMPPQVSAPAIGATPSRPRPPAPTSRLAAPGGNFTTGTGSIAMIWIPPGTLVMSNPQGSDDDTLVTLSHGFWLGQTELTQAQWQPLMPRDPLPSHFRGSDRPVEWISWLSALDFCHRLTARERAAGRLPDHYEYTLPTEAQWEFACRAGTTGSFAGDLDAMAWYEKNSGNESHPVGQKRPNAWGLYDMHGNVGEWCLDAYGGYPGGHVIDPVPDLTGHNASAPRMARGGGWASSAGQCRSAGRYRVAIGYTGAGLGMRVALVPAANSPAAEKISGSGLPSGGTR